MCVCVCILYTIYYTVYNVRIVYNGSNNSK